MANPPLSPTELALIRAIYEADPDDDEPRLVYADYLQQRGDPRGELIAVQCRDARSPGDALAHRALNLFDADESRWLGAWQGEAIAWRFRRGFLYHLAIPIDAFVILGELLAAEPFPHELVHLGSLELREPRSAGGDPSVVSLIAILRRLRLQTLSLDLPVSIAFAHTLAASSVLSQLTTLRLEEARHERDVPAILMRGSPMERLHTLELRNCHFNDREATNLAGLPRFRQVRRLDLTTGTVGANVNELSPDGVVALLTANPALTALELRGNLHFDLRNDIRRYTSGDRTVPETLAELRPPLVELGLGNTYITTPAVASLAALPTLERLDLRGNSIGDDALDTLLALPALTTLNLAHTSVTHAGAARIQREAQPSLRELTLTVPGLSSALVAALHARFELHRWR